MSEVTYETKRSDPRGVVSSLSGQRGRADQPPLPEREGRFKDGRTWTIEKFRN